MVGKFSKVEGRRKLTVGFFATIVLIACLIVSTLIFFRAFDPATVDEEKLAAANEAEFRRKTKTYQAVLLKGDHEKSLASLREIIEVLDRTPSQETARRAMHHLVQAEFLMQMNRDIEASKCVADARKILIENSDLENATYCEVLSMEGKLLARKHKYQDAIEHYQQSLSCLESMSGLFSPQAGNALACMGTAYLAPEMNQPEKALEFFTMYEASLNSTDQDKSLELINCHKSMAIAYLYMHKYPEAEEKLNLAKETAFRKLPADHPQCVHIKQIMAQLEQSKSRQ